MIPRLWGSGDADLNLHSFIHSFVRLFIYSLSIHQPETVVHTEDIQAVESLPAPMEAAFQLCDLKKIT